MFGCKRNRVISKKDCCTEYICPEMKALNYECPTLKDTIEGKCPLLESHRMWCEQGCKIYFDDKSAKGTLIIGDKVHKVYLVEIKADSLDFGWRYDEKGNKKNAPIIIKKGWRIIEC